MFDLFAEPIVRKEPRPYQREAIHSLKLSLMDGNRRPCLMMPTGAGKSLTAALIVESARAKGKRVCFTVPMISLIDQTVEAFEAEGLHDVGVIQASHPRTDARAPVQVASVQTLARRSFPEVDLVIVDEAHVGSEVIRRWMDQKPRVPFIGLSATPWRKGMGKEYDALIVGTTTADLIEAGYLAPFRVFAPAHPDLSGVKIRAGDYDDAELSAVMQDGKLVADVVGNWLEHGEGRPALCFAVDRAHAKHLQRKFASAGVSAAYVDAYTDAVERKLIMDRFHSGEVKVVCNVGVLTTGVDWDVRCIILARPTRSEMLFVQMVGRGLRTAPGKTDCLIFDHSDTTLRLGFVTDIHHESFIEGKAAQKAEREQPTPLPKECPKCSYLKPAKVGECPACGFKPEKSGEIETGDGELVQIKGKARTYTREEKQLWYSGLLGYCQQKGKAKGFAAHTYRERFGVWPKGLDETPMPPPEEVQNFIRSKLIRFAKRRAK